MTLPFGILLLVQTQLYQKRGGHCFFVTKNNEILDISSLGFYFYVNRLTLRFQLGEVLR
jgi:hypothetical protein